jgi:thiaminase (transcriptional activator TenA)
MASFPEANICGSIFTGTAVTNETCKDLNPAQKARVREAFVVTSRYEWMFWDAAWKLERWPVR